MLVCVDHIRAYILITSILFMETSNQPVAVGAETVVSDEMTTGTTIEQTDPAVAVTEPQKSSRARLYIVLGIIVLILLGAGGYYYYKNYVAGGGPVAIVNGFKIARTEFNDKVALVTQTASLQGANISDPQVQSTINSQVVEMLVNDRVLLDAAEAAGFTPDTKEVQAELDKITENVGGAEALKARLPEAGLTEESLREKIAIDLYLRAQTDVEDVQVTEEEIQALYDSYKTGGVEVPPYESIKPQLEAQLQTQKQSDIVGKYLESLKEKATIEIKL